tara:strand:- start:1483 stop:2040 length:558 start_codon:yes stop_codon:yes gene_type:complete
MSSEELSPYTEEEIDEWVNRDVDWERIRRWQSYLLAKRQSYIVDRQRAIGSEYFHDSHQWDMIFSREWAALEERMNSGIGVDTDVVNEFGDDFFKVRGTLLEEIDVLYEQLEDTHEKEGTQLTIYTYEDFLMLSNQGIFRDKVFILDPQRKWRKIVEKSLKEYGYDKIERILIQGVNYLVVEKEA